jgi:hypothetical protein
MAYKWTNVSIDGLVSIPAYVDDNVRWYGWLCPYFKTEDVHLIQEMLDLISYGDVIEYDADKDAFVVRNAFMARYVDGDEEWYHGKDVNGMHLYPIGAGCWIWMED